MAWGKEEKKQFREGFTGTKEPKKKEESSYAKNEARRKRFLDSLSPAEKKERQEKIKSQGGYKDGGVVKDKYCKIKKMLKK